MGYRTFICSFSNGWFEVYSPSGKVGLSFEDSDRFGPAKIDLRNGDLSEISDRHNWFWDWYPRWREHGRPTVGKRSIPLGEVMRADIAIPPPPTPSPPDL